LTDTSYITKATAEYLRCLFEQDHDVLGLKGQLTSELRWHWGLETVLQELPDSPGWQDEKAGKLRPGEKNRADHRHHAVDAVVVAMTNRSRLQKLSRIVKTGGAKKTWRNPLRPLAQLPQRHNEAACRSEGFAPRRKKNLWRFARRNALRAHAGRGRMGSRLPAYRLLKLNAFAIKRYENLSKKRSPKMASNLAEARSQTRRK